MSEASDSPTPRARDAELPPCPFCGARDDPLYGAHIYDDVDIQYVRCGRCGARGPAGKDPDEAVVLWSKREAAAFPEMLDAMRKLVEWHDGPDYRKHGELLDLYDEAIAAVKIALSKATDQ